MAVSRVKVWSAGEVLTASDLNSEFNNIISNGEDLGSPRSSAFDLNGQQLIIDADADSYLVEHSDDVVKLRLQGVDLFYFDGDVTSPVNGLTFTASATGVGVTIGASGSDSNINLILSPKGTGLIDTDASNILIDTGQGIVDENSNEQLLFSTTSSAVNNLQVANAATGNGPTLSAVGGDTNVPINITPKGSGAVKLGGTGNVFYLNNVKVRPVRVGAIYFSFNHDSDYEVKLDGRTIGSAASGADNASADYSDVYAILWDNLADAEAAVSGGRGASAAADFAANKTLTLPDFSGRVPGGLDNMSGSSRNVITNTAADTAGKKMGAETHTLTKAEAPSGLLTLNDPGHTHTSNASSVAGGGAWASGGSGFTSAGATIDSATTGITLTDNGSDDAHNNTQPTIFGYWVIAY